MEGPFYKAGAPTRSTLVEPGTAAERLVLTGRVLSRDCKPVANASLDFWHADEKGEYDNGGYRYRGKATSGGEGRYRLETILPALYPGRPRHIHVKVQMPGTPALTTQIYFRNEHPGPLSVAAKRRDGVLHAEFDFVLQ
jgi:protocatechuate 3,4-dioxygenase beta subunit